MTHPPASSGPAGAPEIPGLGPRLREHRARTGLTLEAAAARLGLSPAHLSRLETGRRHPSLPVLLVLARTYDATVAELLGEEPTGLRPVIRGGLMESVPAGGWTYWQAGAPGRAMQALRLHVPQGPQNDLVRVHPGEEWLYVQRGRLRLVLGGGVHLLDPGDAAHYDSLTPHRIAAVSGDGVDLLFVHTLVQSAPASLCIGGTPPHPRDQERRHG